MAEQTIRLNLDQTRARSNLASFGSDVDKLINSLEGILLQVRVDDTALKQVQRVVEDLDTTITPRFAVDDGNLVAVARQVQSLDTVVTPKVDIQDGDLASVTRRLEALDTTVTSKLLVNAAELDEATRKANSFPDPIDTKIEVDDSKLKSALSTAAGVTGGLALGGGVAAGFAQALSLEQVVDKVDAQLGLTEEAAKQAGIVASNLYKNAWGDSVGEVGAAISSVGTQLVDLNAIGQDELQSLSIKALDVAKVMDVDVSEATRAVGQLIRNGLVKDATEGFDLIALAQEKGLNRSGDLLDTLNEYAVSFGRAGLTGEQAMGVINEGLEAGIFNTDKIGDLFNEFTIRAIDGSTTTNEALEKLGFNADEFARKIAAGGPAAAGATSQVTSALARITDQVQQDAIGVALFGTIWEDMGADAVLALDAMNDGIGETTGAAQKMSETLNDNAAVAIESFKRKALAGLVDFLGRTVIPFILSIAPTVSRVFTGVADFVAPLLTSIIGLFNQALPYIQQFAEQAIAFLTADVLPRIQAIAPVIAGVFESIGPALVEDVLPLLGDFASIFVNQILPVVVEFGATLIEELLPVLARTLRDDVLPFLSLLATVFIEDILPAVQDLAVVVIRDVLPAVVSLASTLIDDVLPPFLALAAFLIETLVPILAEIITWVAKLIGVLGDLKLLAPLVAAALVLMFGPFGVAGAVIAAVVVGLIQLYQNVEIVRTVVDGVVGVFQFLIDKLGGLENVLKLVGIAIGGLILGPFAALAAAVYLVIRYWDDLVGATQAAWDAIGSLVSTAVGALSGVLSAAGEVITAVWAGIWGGVTGLLGTVVDALRTAGAQMVAAWNATWSTISAVAVAAFEAVVTVIGGFLSAVSATLEAVVGAFQAAFGVVLDVVSTALDAIRAVIDAVLSVIATIVSTYVEVWTTIISAGFEVIATVVGTYLDIVVELWTTAFDVVRAVVETVLTIVFTLVTDFLRGLQLAIDAGLTGIRTIWSTGWGFVSSVVSTAWSGIQRIVSTAMSVIRTIIGLQLAGIQTVWSTGWSIVSTTFYTAYTTISTIVGYIRTALGRIKDAVQGVIDAVATMVSFIKSAYDNSIGKLTGLASKIPGPGLVGDALSFIGLAKGGVVERPTITMMGEIGREAVLPEYASLGRIRDILAETNILARLEADFSERQRAAFYGFNARAAAAGRPQPSPASGPSHHYDGDTYHLSFPSKGESMAAKQRTAREVVSAIKKTKGRRTYAGGPRWRS